MSLQRDLMTALAEHLNSRVPRAVPRIRNSLAASIERAVRNSPEYHSLVGGKLQAELGVADPLGVLERVILGLVNGVEVRFQKLEVTNFGYAGGLTVNVLRQDLSDVLSVEGASFTSEGGYRIDWLQWLLTAGDAVVVAEYAFLPGDVKGSRTGLGVMKRGGAWGVPPEFAGTVKDNFLTRALASVGEEVQLTILKHVFDVL